MKLLPKRVIVLGMILAVAGELSWFHLVSPKALFLIPLAVISHSLAEEE